MRTISLSRIIWTTASLISGAVGAYIFWIRPWHSRWGATVEELHHQQPGDELLPEPVISSTRAVTIEAAPETVWAWLAQIGYERAGWYSYDALERMMGVANFAEGSSAQRILPQFQDLRQGDTIKTDPSGGLTVWSVKIPETLVLRARIGMDGKHFPFEGTIPGRVFECVWSFHLHPVNDGSATRLVTRCQFSYQSSLTTSFFGRVLLEPAVFLMERKMLLGIRKRAESTTR